MNKNEIKDFLLQMREKVLELSDKFKNPVSMHEYAEYVRVREDGKEIWTKAFQKAIDENEFVFIPSKDTPYFLDDTVIISSNRHIKAEDGAVIRLTEETTVLMMRNKNTKDGSDMPIDTYDKDDNISITGGRWEESRNTRLGYGRTGLYDKDRSFFGVSTCMFFNNIENLSLTNMTFAHAAGFAVQTGNLKNGVFENITFCECYADGLHINGNTENLFIRNIQGQVGDDLVALNMYDWKNSSVNFGPMKNVFCENLDMAPDGEYKAMRILPGVYYFKDNSYVDCSVENLYVKNVKGVTTFKLYLQTRQYVIGEEEPECGAVGSGDNIYFEDINVDLTYPIDAFDEYLNSDPIRGAFACFEFGSNIKNVYFKNIDITLHKDKFPLSYFITVGPKSIRNGEKEVFDPYLSSVVENIYIDDVRINGCSDWNIEDAIKVTSFENVNNDGKSTARGRIGNIICE